jgi:hypothetical protein
VIKTFRIFEKFGLISQAIGKLFKRGFLPIYNIGMEKLYLFEICIKHSRIRGNTQFFMHPNMQIFATFFQFLLNISLKKHPFSIIF